MLGVAMAGVASAALTGVLGLARPLQAWLLPAAVAAAAASGALAAAVAGMATPGQGAALGALTGGIAAAFRLAVGALPSARRLPTQLTGAAGSVLVTGLVCYVVTRTMLG